MKNKKTQDTAQGVSPMPAPLRGRLIALLAATLALCLLAGVLAVFTFVDFEKENTPGGGGTNTNTGFVYRDTVITDYIALAESMVAGLVIPGFESRVDEVTDESVKEYINRTLLSAAASAASKGFPLKTKPIGYGDEVCLYILYVEDENGERVGEKYFNNAYMDVDPTVQIGMEVFGPSLDEALIGLIPKDVGSFELRTMGEVEADDVILFTYTVKETTPATEEGKDDKVETHADVSAERIELARRDAAWVAKVLESYGAIGQTFSFEYEEDIDEDGKTETVTYEGVISAVVEDETSTPITVALPDDYFGKTETGKLETLNGKTLTFYINVDFSIDHEVNTAENMTLADMVNTLKFTPTDKKDLDAARTECLAHFKKTLTEDHDSTVKSTKLSLIWTHLLDNLVFTGTLPEAAITEMKNYYKQQLEYEYSQYSGSTSDFSALFPEIDDYAVYVWGYEKEDYEGYEDYIEKTLATRSVKQQLLTVGIYRTFINDKAKLDAELEELINMIIENNNKDTKTYVRQDVIDYYGEDYLRDSAMATLVEEYLLEKNTVDWDQAKDPE